VDGIVIVSTAGLDHGISHFMLFEVDSEARASSSGSASALCGVPAAHAQVPANLPEANSNSCDSQQSSKIAFKKTIRSFTGGLVHESSSWS
jgi:hypothetical protein